MREFQPLLFANLVLLLAACGGKSASDAATTLSQSNGASNSTGGHSNVPVPAAGGSTQSAAGNSNSSIGGISQSQGGTNGTQGSSAAGGSVSAGGAAIAGGQVGTGGASPLPCGADACAAANANCGSIIDGCGVAQDCGTCAAGATCGVIVANQCYSCDTPITACPANANCGFICDGCGRQLNCGVCTGNDQCFSNVCTPAIVPAPVGLAQTCIAGSLGCFCDSTGACAPGLNCTAQITNGVMLNVCCDSTGNCTAPSTSTGPSCGVTGYNSCVPGITIPTATATTDNCGYATTSFTESSSLCGVYATGGGSTPAQIQAYFNDEWPLTLGCASSTYTVSAMSTTTLGDVYYPQTGDPSCNDTAGRPMRPTLFITDITGDGTCKAGDQQAGGKAYDPIAVFGTWTYANAAGAPALPSGVPKNYWTLGTGADQVPTYVNNQCPCTDASNCPGSGTTGKGYGAEVRYEAGLISGHSYRLQIILHDSDQTQGGDSGEVCVYFCAGSSPCTPLTCADYPPGTYAQKPDGCGGVLNCGCPPAGTCIPRTCEDNCPADANGKRACSSVNDLFNGIIVQCTKSTGCANPAVEQCWCLTA